jgi:hypothetical protein
LEFEFLLEQLLIICYIGQILNYSNFFFMKIGGLRQKIKKFI